MFEMATDKFQQYFRKLNPAQREAVETIEGPVMVVAGPGTGKTQVLTLRIANILRQMDASPDSILALTFTKSAAHSMRERLVEIIGSAAYRVNIDTFHGFCNELILNYPEEFPRMAGSKNASRFDQIRILEEIILKSRKLKLLRPFGDPFHYLKDALSEIERIKKENISPAEFKKLIEKQKTDSERDLLKNRELAEIYRAYEECLKEEKLYDFSDMIIEVIGALETNQDFLLRLQEEYQYILADEHQDANNSQNKLLELLTNFHDEPNLFIVGDEKQAIFQFQGASLDNFNYFKRLFPKAKLVTLKDNYRSPQGVLDSAHSLIEKSALPRALLAPLVARGPGGQKAAGKPIIVRGFARAEHQYRFLADEIKAKIAAGISPDSVAILYRDNQDAWPITEALERDGVPFVIQSELDILSDPQIDKVVTLLKAIRFFGKDEWLFRALHLDFLGADSLDVFILAEAGRKGKAYSLISNQRELRKLRPRNHKTLTKIFRDLEQWHKLSFELNLVDLFGKVLDESGFVSALLTKPDAPEKLAKLQSLYLEIKNLTSRNRRFKLSDFVSYLELLQSHNLSLSQSVDSGLSGVRLMTVHRAKGLEFDFVYITDAYDGHFGNRRRRGGFRIALRGAALNQAGDDEDERRLFYVALTRAKREVTILYPKQKEDRNCLPSRFIEEIDKNLIYFAETAPVEAGYDGALPAWTQPKPEPKPKLSEKSYLNKIFLERGLSVTELNNYLACPLKYFYTNLLRITDVQNKHLMFGTAVHGALRDFFDRYREGERWGKKELGARFKYHLEREPLSDLDYQETLAKGRKALGGYLDWHKYSWPERIINEFKVRGVLIAPNIKLNGKIDKVELPKVGREVRVIDYKTGKPKTRNHILGETKTGNGDYFRQLVFYKLLLDNYDRGKYDVSVGMIDFVEPDEQGRYKQEEFAITPEAVAELKELVLQTADDILNLKFFTRGCGKKDCEFCRLYEMSGMAQPSHSTAYSRA